MTLIYEFLYHFLIFAHIVLFHYGKFGHHFWHQSVKNYCYFKFIDHSIYTGFHRLKLLIIQNISFNSASIWPSFILLSNTFLFLQKYVLS